MNLMNLFSQILSRFWLKFIDYLPQLVAGFLIVLFGLIVVKIFIKFIKFFFKFFPLKELAKKYKLISEEETKIWESVFLEVIKVIVFLVFLMPAFEVWGLNKATILLNQLINFLPNVIISIVIAFFGIIFANLGEKLVHSSFSKIKTRKFLGFLAKAIILFFTALIILNQLGVAQDLIRILFAGIIGMVAIAGGIAFGLGGKDTAKEVLESLKKNIS